jgi:hypothetical protein
MAISDLTGPHGDGERDEHVDGEEDEAAPFANADASFAEEQARDNADEVFQDEELPLPEDETRLPWLESDDEEEAYGGYNVGQTIALVLALLLVLGLVVGGIWWLTREGPDEDLVADGSTIKSEGPYKQRPENPGGKVFEGTGDSSFKVSEGQSSPARLGEAGPEDAKPGFASLDKKGEGEKAAGSDGSSETAVDTTGVGVQVGAYSDRAKAEAGWSRLAQQYDALSGLRHRVVEGRADIGTVYRLQAIADGVSEANKLCSQLKSSGLNCYVKR